MRLLLVGSAWMASAARSDAAGYYTVTALGTAPSFNTDSDAATQSVTNTQTGVTYPFVTTMTPITAADLQNLPGETVMQGVEYPRPQQYVMSVVAMNSSGTVVGTLPTGLAHADPWESRMLGFAVRSADGRYSPFVPLLEPGYFYSSYPGTAFLSQANQILVYNNQNLSVSLYNVATGTTTPIGQLFPPALLQQLTGSSTGENAWFEGQGIDDRGDILVTVGSAVGSWPGQSPETFLLTPPDLAAPTPTPEPSSLLIFGLVAGALGLRTAVRRSRGDSIDQRNGESDGKSRRTEPAPTGAVSSAPLVERVAGRSRLLQGPNPRVFL